MLKRIEVVRRITALEKQIKDKKSEVMSELKKREKLVQMRKQGQLYKRVKSM